MNESQSKRAINNLSAPDRYAIAQQKMAVLLDAFLEHLRIHANNKIVVYSDTISKQVPRSYAAHSYSMLLDSLIRYEFINVCKFWETPDFDGFSIPTICALADNLEVKKIIARNHHLDHAQHDIDLARKSANTARARLHRALISASQFENNSVLRETKNLRDKLVHVIEISRAEKNGAVPSPKYGFERRILLKTKAVINNLNLSICGSDFFWDSSIAMNKRNAEAFWHGVTIKVLR